mgnify:CR=1 FL=1
MNDQLLKLAREIISLCDEILENKTSPNIDVIKLIKREFEEQFDLLISEDKVKVLNNKYDLWAVRTIYDSAFFEYDQNLFRKVFEFAKICKHLKKSEVIIMYPNG